MSERLILPHKAEMEYVTVYYHPHLETWTPSPGVPTTLKVYGTKSVRAGEMKWQTDLIDPETGQLPFMERPERRALIAAVKAVLRDILPETKITEIVHDVINYER